MKKEDEQKESRIGLRERRRFQTSLRDELIKSIESGFMRSVIAHQYGMSRATLSNWTRDHESQNRWCAGFYSFNDV